MKQKRKVKSLLSSKQLFDKGEFKVLLVAGGCTLFLCALSLFTLSVGVALGDNNGAHLSYSGVNDRIEVLYHLGFTNADTLLDKDYMVMSGKSLYVSPRSVVVNEVASCPGWGYSSEWCFSDDNEVSAGNYGNILGGNYNKVSSNNVTIIAGNNNTVRAGNDNVTVLGGKSNIVDSNIFGTPSVMVGGNGNLLGSGSSNAVVGGTGNSITGGAIGSSVLGGSGNKIQGYKGDVIVGGENVVVDGGVNNVFAYSSKSSEFKPESSNAFYLDTNNGLGINVASVDGVTTSGAVSFGEIDINISCNSTIIGLQGSRNGCLVGCTSTSASRDSKRELLDRGSECGKKCRENNRCLAGNEDDSNKPDYPAFCTDNVNITNAHLCSDEKDSYKNVIFETYLVDNGGCPSGASGVKNKCVYECDEHAKLLTDHTGKHNVDGNPETACFKSCRDPINGKWILHNGRARLYENDEYMCADQCGDHMGDVVCNDGKWYDIGSDGKAAEETQKHESCTTMPSSCSSEFKLAACPLNGNCSSCAPYTVNNNSCVKGVTGYQLNSCNDINNCSAITYRVSDDIRTQHSEDSEYGSCDLYEPNSDRTNCGPNTIYQLIGCKGANHTEQGTPSWMQYCISNTKQADCTPAGGPDNSVYEPSQVEITWQGYGATPWKDGSWSTPANCEWNCIDTYVPTTDGRCVPQIVVLPCEEEGKPDDPNAYYKTGDYAATYNSDTGEYDPVKCPWDCMNNTTKDGDSCKPNINQGDCNLDSMPDNYKTLGDTAYAIWSYKFAQELKDGEWFPDSMDYDYVPVNNYKECVFSCKGINGYVWDEDVGECVESSEPEPIDEPTVEPIVEPTNGCTGPEPENAEPVNGAGTDETANVNGLYDASEASNYSCSWKCKQDYTYVLNGGSPKCVQCERGTYDSVSKTCNYKGLCQLGTRWHRTEDPDCVNLGKCCLRLGNCLESMGDHNISNGIDLDADWSGTPFDGLSAGDIFDKIRPLGYDKRWACYESNSSHKISDSSVCEIKCKEGYKCGYGSDVCLKVQCATTHWQWGDDMPSEYWFAGEATEVQQRYEFVSSWDDFKAKRDTGKGCWFYCPESAKVVDGTLIYCYKGASCDSSTENPLGGHDSYRNPSKYREEFKPVSLSTLRLYEKNGVSGCYSACKEGYTEKSVGSTDYCIKECGPKEYFNAHSGCLPCSTGKKGGGDKSEKFENYTSCVDACDAEACEGLECGWSTITDGCLVNKSASECPGVRNNDGDCIVCIEGTHWNGSKCIDD